MDDTEIIEEISELEDTIIANRARVVELKKIRLSSMGWSIKKTSYGLNEFDVFRSPGGESVLTDIDEVYANEFGE